MTKSSTEYSDNVWREIVQRCEEYLWEQADLARVLGYSEANVSNLVNGKLTMNFQLANQLFEIFGESHRYWMDRSNPSLKKTPGADLRSREKRMTEVYRLFPIRELARKKWLSSDSDPDVIEQELMTLLGEATYKHVSEYLISYNPRMPVIPRSMAQLSPERILWIRKAQHISKALRRGRYQAERVSDIVTSLRDINTQQDGVDELIGHIVDAGISLVKVGSLKSELFDIMLFWQKGRPVIAFPNERFNPYIFWTSFHGILVTLDEYYCNKKHDDQPEEVGKDRKRAPYFTCGVHEERIFHMKTLIDLPHVRPFNPPISTFLTKSDLICGRELLWSWADRGGLRYNHLTRDGKVSIPEGSYIEQPNNV